MLKNNLEKYGLVAKFLHWLIFFLVIGMLVLGYSLGYLKPDTMLFAQVINIHKLLGLSILILMIIRLVWALMNPKPLMPPGSALWERIAERVVHFSLYAVLIAMPIAGWIMAVAAGHPPKLFSWQISLPVPESKTISGLFFNVHNTLAIVLIVLISIHVLAALFHFMIKKDNVLQRMMPED